jgi:hypothetical protein
VNFQWGAAEAFGRRRGELIYPPPLSLSEILLQFLLQHPTGWLDHFWEHSLINIGINSFMKLLICNLHSFSKLVF